MSIICSDLQQPCTAMRITNSIISHHRKHRETWNRRTTEAILLDLPNAFACLAATRAMHERRNVKKLLQRKRNIRSTRFNVNILPEHHCLQDHRFKISYVSGIAKLNEFPKVTTRIEYKYEKMTAICFSSQRLVTTVCWSDVEQKYRLFSSQVSEVFWDVIELFTENNAGLFDIAVSSQHRFQL